MIHKRKPIDEVSKDLDHSRISTTVDVYLHPKKKSTKKYSFPEIKLF